MKQVFMRQQRGVSLFGLITGLILVGFVGLIAAQVVPTYSEYRSIMDAIVKAKEVGGSVRDIQMSFNKAASVNYIESLKAADLEITKENGVFEVSFEYEKKIHIAGPMSIVMDYKGSTMPDAPPGVTKKPKE
jgi:DNA-dependent RNA polymerase auxiliary subunit epsilon